MTTALPSALVSELEASGYFPQAAAACLARGLRSAPVQAHLVRPETTFDGNEVRRHLTVLVLTARHLVVTHLDDEPADELNPSQVVATTERVRLDRVGSMGLSQVFTTEGTSLHGQESEVTLGISWGGSRRLDLERAWCEDPECQADHGYTGTSAPSDLALRISALADGPGAVASAIAFHEQLMDAVDDACA
ncbi:DUF5998 family protein [Brachybacterium hainanense]|uniref:DUF5998 family protein n=1 Tax=Brachybacterium hainanense TaxID=1541174 RepID=A0ABV6RDT7_9MICO